jgi:hypothetical protein
MNAATSIHAPNRIAAGVTAAYLIDLTRRPAQSPGDGPSAVAPGHRGPALRFSRPRDDCAARGGVRPALVS